jgi:environmental stress-induced protein Ves
MHVLRRSDYTPMRWKNGAGTTLEIALHGRHGEAFDWRLSMALVDADCTFSSFEGYQRQTTLVDGPGFDLFGPDARPLAFARVGEVHAYDGAVAWACRLRGGACRDLNLIVRSGLAASMEGVRVAGQPLELAAGAADRWLVPLDEPLELCLGACVATVLLEARDALFLAAGETATLRPAAGGGGGWLAIASLPPSPRLGQD